MVLPGIVFHLPHAPAEVGDLALLLSAQLRCPALRVRIAENQTHPLAVVDCECLGGLAERGNCAV